MGGWYCTDCGARYSRPGAGIIYCQRCGKLGLRGYDRVPKRVTCPHGCGIVGWDDGDVNDDLGNHLRREHRGETPTVDEMVGVFEGGPDSVEVAARTASKWLRDQRAREGGT